MEKRSDDPRRPQAIAPYQLHAKDPDDLPLDMYALASVIFGIIGLMFKVGGTTLLATAAAAPAGRLEN